MNRLRPDAGEITRALAMLYQPGDVVELRVPGARGTASGYFNDTAALTRALMAQDGAAGIYLSLNPVVPDLLARAKNRVIGRAKATTADRDIARRRHLLIDCDPRRPAGISATDAEHEAAIERAKDIRTVLTEEFAWPAPILADSGNGGHLSYLIDLPNDDASAKMLEAVLRVLSARFSDAVVDIDRTVFNAARIVKAYGTVARKGDDLRDERPHRLSRILDAPQTMEPVSRELLEQLAGRAPAAPPDAPRVRPPRFSVEQWIRDYRLPAREPVANDGGRKWVLEECPFNCEHKAPDAAIFEGADGKPGFKCLHNSCSDYHWRELRERVEGPRQPRHESRGDYQSPPQAKAAPEIISLAALMKLDVPPPEMLIEGILPLRGASLLVGPPKSGKTILSVATALSVAGGSPLLDYYRVLKPGPSMLIEQDDPGATASVKDIVSRSPLSKLETPFYLVPKVPFNFGPEFLAWLENQIRRLSLRLVVLDSYTALRASRTGGGDIVKAEQEDLTQLDALAKRTNSCILILHHNSKGSASLDWSQQAAGTFAMGAATEAQVFISRFPDLESAAPERLVRVRGRHGSDVEVVLRFRADKLDYEYVIAGSAAPLYSFIQQLQGIFGSNAFAPKDLCQETGVSRATAHRYIDRLYRAEVLRKRRHGDYVLSVAVPALKEKENEIAAGTD